MFVDHGRHAGCKSLFTPRWQWPYWPGALRLRPPVTEQNEHVLCWTRYREHRPASIETTLPARASCPDAWFRRTFDRIAASTARLSRQICVRQCMRQTRTFLAGIIELMCEFYPAYWRCLHSMRNRVCETVGRLSVCLFHLVPQSRRPAGLLLWAPRPDNIDRLLHSTSAAGAAAFRSRSTAAWWSAANATSVVFTATQEAEHWHRLSATSVYCG